MGSSSSKTASKQPPSTSNNTLVPTRDNQYGLLYLNPSSGRSPGKGQLSQERYPVDIVAIHGLTGDAYTTWTDPTTKAFWLRDFLPKQFPGARIFSFGYPAQVFCSLGTGDFETFARTLLEDVKGVRRSEQEKRRPIIFICHSMGGIVVKQALITAIIDEMFYNNISRSTSGILFLATPHFGSDATKFVPTVLDIVNVSLTGTSRFIGNMRSDLVRDLERNSKPLGQIARNFRHSTRNIQIASFVEGKRTKAVHINKKVVDEGTGIMNVPGEEIIMMPTSDHREICRFPNETNDSYQRVLRILQQFANKAVSKVIEELASEELPCLHSLTYPEMDQRRQEADLAYQNTCTWILHHRSYLQWTYQSQGLLWIKGSPGTGKSTLMAFIFRQFLPTNNNLTLSFFFHGRGTILQKSAEGLFRTLLHQLFTQSYEVRAPILKAFQAKKGFGEVGKGWEWQLRELQDLFSSVVTQVSKKREVMIFVDALDEAGSEVAARLVGYFHRLNDEFVASDCWVRIAIACRHYPVVALIPGLSVSVEEENFEDIRTVVRSQLMTHVLRRNEDISFSDSCYKLESAIVTQAKGLFQWASLVVPMVVEALNDGRSFDEVHQIVADQSSELFTLYEHILKNIINIRNHKQTLHLMQWICLAVRPLSLAELRFALACDEVSYPDEYLYWEDKKGFIESDERMQMLTNSLSGGLVEVKYHRHRSTVQFVHQTVNEFLLSGGLEFLFSTSNNVEASTPELIIGCSEEKLARSCINYLGLGEIEHEVINWKEESKDKHIFLEYATKSWFVHAERAEEHGITQEDIVQQFKSPPRLFENWVELFQNIDKHAARCPDTDSSLIHVAASSNLLGTVKTLLGNGVSIDEVDGSKYTALHHAARWGHLRLVSFLLDENADISAKSELGNTPLERAAANGNTEVVKALLTRGAEINQNAGYSGSALQSAAFAGNTNLVQILVECGADANAGGGEWGSPLQAAALSGIEEVVNILLDHGANVNAKGGFYGNALQAACAEGTLSTIKRLLKSGADINMRGGEYETALQAASYAAYWNSKDIDSTVVRFLIDSGADVSIIGGKYGNALQAAASTHNADVVQILLDRGVKFNMDGPHSFSYGVQKAAFDGDEALVKSLLAESAEYLQRGAYYENLLEVATRLGYARVADLIVKNGGVDVIRMESKKAAAKSLTELQPEQRSEEPEHIPS